MQTVLLWLAHYGYPALFALLMFGIVGLPIPDETLLTFTGYLVYRGQLHFGPAFVAGFCGCISGISISYFLGANFARQIFTRYGKFMRLTPDRMIHVERLFLRFGPVLLTIGYFIPGVRHFTAIVAGMSGLRWPKFAVYAYSGGALWVSAFLSLGYVMGERWQHSSELVHRYILIATGIIVLALLLFWLVRRMPIDNKKRRRMQ